MLILLIEFGLSRGSIGDSQGRRSSQGRREVITVRVALASALAIHQNNGRKTGEKHEGRRFSNLVFARARWTSKLKREVVDVATPQPISFGYGRIWSVPGRWDTVPNKNPELQMPARRPHCVLENFQGLSKQASNIRSTHFPCSHVRKVRISKRATTKFPKPHSGGFTEGFSSTGRGINRVYTG